MPELSRTFVWIALAGLLVVGAPSETTAEPPAPGSLICDRVLDSFARSELGKFPAGWRTKHEHNAEEARRKGLFKVELDGKRRALHITYGTHTITIARKLRHWNLQHYPILQWRWKAVKLPIGGDETDSDTNDSAASVYLAWKAAFPMNAKGFRFSWSSSLPVGTHVSKRLGHDHVVVLESGPRHMGQWRKVQIDVLEEYEKRFGERPRAPIALALTSDADQTGSRAEAYFADFRLCRYAK